MNAARFDAITGRYGQLRVALVGDFCLDRYLEIDPARKEISIETGREVHNVVRVRSQPGAAGTILNNLVDLGMRTVHPVGFCGVDGEGFELRRALAAKRGVEPGQFVETAERRTFTYCKPLVIERERPPLELNRLDSKNWSPTPESVQTQLIAGLQSISAHVDAVVVMDQVDVAGTGVVTPRVLEAIGALTKARPELLIIADSRRGLRGYPPVAYKMNQAELASLFPVTLNPQPSTLNSQLASPPAAIHEAASSLARANRRPVFVTLSEQGIIGADADGKVEYVPALPVRGEIDIVGAGDAVMANLAAALGAGASVREALELANAAASIVIHQLGTTGTATIAQLRNVLCR